jgi:hypothetical protein
MQTAYLVITLLFALMVSYSGVGKIQRHPLQVRVVHETVGVPLKYFPLLAASANLPGQWDSWSESGGRQSESRRELAWSSTSWVPSYPICVSAMSKALGLPHLCWCLPQERSPFVSRQFEPRISNQDHDPACVPLARRRSRLSRS